ncbi:hypothetical protein SRABI128_06014 [Microbacterium sp. Bi128]|nr:hypothetical protein SRABI128_06014 [Microbacterium sp. Bi128]
MRSRTDENPFSVQCQLSGPERRRVRCRQHWLQFDPLALQQGPGARLRRDAAGTAADRQGGLLPVEPAVFETEFRCQADVALLRERDGLAGVDGGQRLGQQDRAAVGEAFEQGPGGVGGVHGLGEGPEDRTGVQPLLQAEGDGTRDVVAGDDGALHGSCAAPGRQQGEVQVHPAVAGDSESRRGNQPAIGHDRRDVRCCGGNAGGDPGIDFGGVDDLNAELGGPGGHGRRRQDAFASQRCVRAGEDSDDVEPGGNKGVERRHRDSGGPGEENPHGVIPKLDPPKLVPTLFARLVVVCSVMAS